MKPGASWMASAALAAAGAAVAASDPVYRHADDAGRVTLSNQPSPGAVLVLAADSPLLRDFRQRFRSEPVAGHGGGGSADGSSGSVQARAAGLPRRLDARIVARVDAAAAAAGLDTHLVRAVVLVESGFRPQALSPAGARGLMQLMPATAARFGVHDPADVDENLRGGTTYLVHLLRLFGGDVRLALAAYNAGEGAVIRHGRRVPPYAETRAYVPAVLSAWRTFREADTR